MTNICPECALGDHRDCTGSYATGRTVPDDDPYRARDRLVPETLPCECTHDETMGDWVIREGARAGTVRLTFADVTVLDLPWRTAMDLAGVIANAAFKSARASGVPYLDAFEAMWLDTWRTFPEEIPSE